MPTTLLRNVFFVCNLLSTFFLFLLPTKLRPNKPTATPPPPPPSPGARHLRRMDSDDLRPVFQMFDRNCDGKITKTELTDSLEKLGIFIPDPELVKMIEKIDADGDGCVDMDEFRTLYKSIMEEREEGNEDMREAFNVFDQNGDGFITAEELKAVMAAMGLKQGSTAEDCRKMITTVDVDGDGRVDFTEFVQMMRGGGFAALG